MIVADEVYDDKAFAIVSEVELTKALKPFGAVDVKLTSFEGFCH